MTRQSATTRLLVTAGRASLHDTLAALAEDFAYAILRAVREGSLRELAETSALEPDGARPPGPRANAPRAAAAPTAPPPVRSSPPPPRRSRAASPDRVEPAQLELLLGRPGAYPDIAIVDPTSILNGSRAAQDASRRTIAPKEARELSPVAEAAPAASEAAAPASVAALPAMRPGEELLRARGGGIVLRRRRTQDAAG